MGKESFPRPLMPSNEPQEIAKSVGVTHEIKVAPNLLSFLDLSKTEVLNADKGYDSEEFRDLIRATKTHPNIPRKKNNKLGNEHMDWPIYKARHVIENTFATLKHFRGIATRFGKLKNSYASSVALACAYIWLRL